MVVVPVLPALLRADSGAFVNLDLDDIETHAADVVLGDFSPEGFVSDNLLGVGLDFTLTVRHRRSGPFLPWWRE